VKYAHYIIAATQLSFSFYFENNNFLADMDLGCISLSSKKGCFQPQVIIFYTHRARTPEPICIPREKLTRQTMHTAFLEHLAAETKERIKGEHRDEMQAAPHLHSCRVSNAKYLFKFISTF